jgi:hypothetical protein
MFCHSAGCGNDTPDDSGYAAASNMMDTHRHKGNPPKRSSGKRRGRQCDGLFDFC